VSRGEERRNSRKKKTSRRAGKGFLFGERGAPGKETEKDKFYPKVCANKRGK